VTSVRGLTYADQRGAAHQFGSEHPTEISGPSRPVASLTRGSATGPANRGTNGGIASMDDPQALMVGLRLRPDPGAVVERDEVAEPDPVHPGPPAASASA